MCVYISTTVAGAGRAARHHDRARQETGRVSETVLVCLVAGHNRLHSMGKRCAVPMKRCLTSPCFMRMSETEFFVSAVFQKLFLGVNSGLVTSEA